MSKRTVAALCVGIALGAMLFAAAPALADDAGEVITVWRNRVRITLDGTEVKVTKVTDNVEMGGFLAPSGAMYVRVDFEVLTNAKPESGRTFRGAVFVPGIIAKNGTAYRSWTMNSGGYRPNPDGSVVAVAPSGDPQKEKALVVR